MAHSTHHADYQVLLSLLKAARERAHLTQVALAEKLGATQTFVSKYERGERRLDLVEIVEICETMSLSPQAFLADYLSMRKSSRRSSAPTGKLSRRTR